MNQALPTEPGYQLVCTLDDLVAESGIAALVAGHQVALFYLPHHNPSVYAVGNFDPIGGANVLSRGIVSDVGGEMAVASPLYKQHFSLATGVCVEQPEVSIPVYPVKLENDRISVCVGRAP